MNTGISQVLVGINKMDDKTVKWSEERYEDIKKKIDKFMKGTGYKGLY
jgi:translation elongation factor EF-1alpha